MPINIGFVGAYTKKIYGSDVNISLFKYPHELLSALNSSVPNIIGFSNYSWNSRLSERFARYAKQCCPEVVVVMGGTNFPQKGEEQTKYLACRPEIDIHIANEGEKSFSNIVNAALLSRDGGPGIFDEPIGGAHFIRPEFRREKDAELISGATVTRLKDLDEIPSPYLTGMLDHFFDGRLTPFLETNRGCPFTCTFCHTGHSSYSKISKFSPERIKAEIAYIAPLAKKLGISNLHLADTNFGMYSSDLETCNALAGTKKTYGWPTQIQATTGKNSKKKILDITSVMGPTLAVNMSVQSMDDKVLSNIQRSNISLNDYQEIHTTLKAQARPSNGELIIGLPGETRDSFVSGLRKVIDAGVTRVANYTLMLLYGTLFKDPEYRKKYSIKGKYRLVPLNFGSYMGESVFDVEEVGVETNSMSVSDYHWLRGLCLFVEVIYNNRPFDPIIRHLESIGIDQFDFILRVYERRSHSSGGIDSIVRGFEQETKGELWNSEKELVDYYEREENYQKLLAGEVGGNLIYKYKAMSIAYHSDEWVDFLECEARNMIKQAKYSAKECDRLIEELGVVCMFSRLRLSGVLSSQADTTLIRMKFDYDILQWLAQEPGKRLPLNSFFEDDGVVYDFFFSERQLVERDEFFRRYGTHPNGLSKIVARVTNVEQLFRCVDVSGRVNDRVQVPVVDEMVRYAIST
jgi:radical SAM superfamily enzyme YgiQ (UPF0313 family)